MRDQVAEAAFVIIVATQNYATRFEKKISSPVGLGATWEGAIITQALYDAGTFNQKFIPVVFEKGDIAHIPISLRAYTRHNLDTDAGYEALYRHVTGQPEIIAAPLGSPRVLAAGTGVNLPADLAMSLSEVPKTAALPVLPVHNHIPAPIPNNLPRLQPFFGREKELTALREALAPESGTWGALIHGPGGMGKTALAVRAAYTCQPSQFERIVFVSVKEAEMDDDGRRPLGNLVVPGLLEMLNELARELGRPEIAKSPEDQRIRLLLEALRSTQTLLVLDNLESLSAAECDQISTFVERLPQGCKALLTSRRRIGSAAEELNLETLDQTAALATLTDLARRNKLLAKSGKLKRIALYKQTGGKPLLLRWVAGQLGRGSCRTLDDALAYLRSCPADNDALEFIFGDLAREFTKDEEKVLCALVYFTPSAKVEHIAEIAGLEKNAAETALHTLANRSLVIPGQGNRHYGLVPMVSEFLRKHRPEVLADTGTRLENRAYALIVENSGDEPDHLPVLDAAWPTVAPALPLFLAGPNDRLQKVCNALQIFLDFTGRWDEWLSFNLQVEEKAVEAGDFDGAGWRAFQVGWVHSLRGQGDEVLACADRATQRWQRAHAETGKRAFGIHLRGIGYRLKKDFPAAIAAFRETLELNRTASPESLAIDLNALAETERLSGDFEAAERDYREALRLAQASDNAEGVATYTGSLAMLALDRKAWTAAEALAREALPMSERVGRKELIASNCHRLAWALVQQQKKVEALPCAQRAVDIFTLLRSPKLESARSVLRECEK